MQNFILGGSLFVLIIEKFFDVSLFLLFFDWLLHLDHNIEHLIIETLKSDLEIQQSHLHTNFRRIMRLA
jgi:hypothetical protein